MTVAGIMDVSFSEYRGVFSGFSSTVMLTLHWSASVSYCRLILWPGSGVLAMTTVS